MKISSAASSQATIAQPVCLGDRLITLATELPEDSPRLESTISFLTQPSFLNNIPSLKFVKTIANMVETFPERKNITKRLIEKIIFYPVIHRIVNETKTIKSSFFEMFDEDIRVKVCKAFKNSRFIEISRAAASSAPYDILPTIDFDPSDKFVSISDVFNESSEEVLDNSSKALQCVDQFQPFTEHDVSDFIINLVSSGSPISKNVAERCQDRNTLLSLLRPFKNTKVTAEGLIKSFDCGSVTLYSQASFNVFLSAIKEVTNSRVVSAAPFLTKWAHSKTQLNFIQHIINSSPNAVHFPKATYQKNSPLLIAEFKGDYWKNLEFVKALSSLYDELPDEINTLLSETSPSNSTAFLLIVLSQSGESSAFAGQLLGNLVTCPAQYMSGISTLWATNKDFLVKTTEHLHNNKPTMLGRCYDIADDLGVIDEFMEMASPEFRTVLEIFSFFRNGNDFRKHLRTLNDIEQVIQIFEHPSDYGFLLPMSFERKLKGAGDNDAKVSADYLFFSFIDEKYDTIDEKTKVKKLMPLFQKCSERSKSLLQYEFHWHKKVTAPVSPRSMRGDLDLPAMAMKTEKKEIDRFNIIVKSLLSDFPKDKTQAEKSGENVGILLSRNLLCCDDSLTAMNLITKGLSLRENTPGFAFAIEAVRAMAPGFELCLPFARQIVTNKVIKRIMPDVHKAAVEACKPIPFELPYEVPVQLTSFDINPRLKRFKYVHPELDRQRVNISRSSKWDNFALGTIHNEYNALTGTHFDDYNYEQVCIEAAVYTVYDLIMNANSIQNVHMKLVRIAKWLSINTIEKRNPSFGRLLNIPDLITYAYENNLLHVVIPFVAALFGNVPEVFYLPCPWSVSILSALGAVYRLPFLRKSLCVMIDSIFKAFHCNIYDVQPKRLRPLDHLPITDSDFLFPPISFDIPTVSKEGLFSGDIESIVAVVSRFFKGGNNQSTKEIALFVHLKVPAIAKSAYETAFALSANDFSHSKDSYAVETYAKSLVRPLCKSLASATVQLEFTYINARSTRFIESLVTMISLQLATNQLINSLKPLRRLREVPEGPFLDVQAFPPSVAAVVPEELWPHSSEKTNNGDGIFGCYNVPSNIKRVYSRFSSLKIDAPIQTDIPYDQTLAQQIYNSFIYNQKGEPVGYNKINIQFDDRDQSKLISTIIHCFPPQFCSEVANLGVSILHQRNLFLGGDMGSNTSVIAIEEMLMNKMPHLSIFVTLIGIGLVRIERVEYILMNFIDEYGIEEIDFSPITDWIYNTITKHESINVQRFQRIFEIIVTSDIRNASYINELRDIFVLQTITDESRDTLKPVIDDKTSPIVRDFRALHNDEKNIRQFIQRNEDSFQNPLFYNHLIKACFPDHRQDLLQIFFAAMNFSKNNIKVLENFIREMYNASRNNEIDSLFLGSVVSAAAVQLRFRSFELPRKFGGFLNDIQPLEYPNFISIWLCLFTIVLPAFLDDQKHWYPSSLLAVALFSALQKFPADWSKHDHFKKLYKSILRIILLLIHDSPNFVISYSLDFLKAIPLRFRRLRNIILSINLEDSYLVNNVPFNDYVGLCQQTFPMFVSTFNKDYNHMFASLGNNQQMIWTYARGCLLAVDTVEDASLIVESLFDFLRCDNSQTQAFENVIISLYNEFEKTYNQLSIRDIIMAILNARNDNLPPLPFGIKSLASKINK